jgi:hypothetical protein
MRHVSNSRAPGEGRDARIARPDEGESMVGINQLRLATAKSASLNLIVLRAACGARDGLPSFSSKST